MIERFTDHGPTAFFTGVKPADVLTPQQFEASPWLPYSYPVVMDLWAEIQSRSRSITPGATASDFGDADTEGLTRLKGIHAREVVDLTMKLLAYSLLTDTYWMDVRRVQSPTRGFGQAPTAVWTALQRGALAARSQAAAPDPVRDRGLQLPEIDSSYVVLSGRTSHARHGGELNAGYGKPN